MNPSASGWINKYRSLLADGVQPYVTFHELYSELRLNGFVYGFTTNVPPFIKANYRLSIDEKAKIYLLHALYQTYILQTATFNFSSFLSCVVRFYADLKISRGSLLRNVVVKNEAASQLEKLLDIRVYLVSNSISKTFNRNITNALLFIDVLLFQRYISQPVKIRKHAELIEYLAINITYHALNSKQKSKFDKPLAELFAASLSYINIDAKHIDTLYFEKLGAQRSEHEKKFFLEIGCITVWEDRRLEDQESSFIFGLGKNLGFKDQEITKTLDETRQFFTQHNEAILYRKDINAAEQFYNSMAKVVDKLILRNSKRLGNELLESKELVYLISKSTIRELSKEEKKKVQNQLLDIFKSIPSLAIFILPGGAVLLPIFIKLIPKLLPSSFDENRVEN